MSAKELEQMRLQQERTNVQLQKHQQEIQRLNARRPEPAKPEFYREPEQQHAPQNQYNEVDPDKELIENIATYAANVATQKVQSNMQSFQDAGAQVKQRMQRLVEKYPALGDEGSKLVIRARDEYQRIATENPSLDEATRYELSVESAASHLGARPVNIPFDPNQDFVMPSSHNPARSDRRSSGKSRLTPNIIANAKIMGINVDPNTKDGQQNLKELDEYSARYNADVDESQYKYK
jgi:hypothetical protein